MSYLKKHDDHVLTLVGYSESIVELSSFLGSVTILICDVCGYEQVFCNHERNTWHNNDTILLCDLCGMDGT